MALQNFHNLSGKILIASPFAMAGGVFYRSIIYVLTHSEQGAAGLIVNHLINKLPYQKLFKATNEANMLSEANKLLLPVYLGGPVEVERGFFLHSSDYDKDILFRFQNDLSVSSNNNILKDIALGKGPKNSLFIIGYTSWEAGQLEQEMLDNLWLIDQANSGLIFSKQSDDKWQIALRNLGISDAFFAPDPGSC